MIEVIVGNIGCVYRGNDDKKAQAAYSEYVAISKHGKGRAGHEPVSLLSGGVEVAAYEGTLNQKSPEERLTVKTALVQWAGITVVVWEKGKIDGHSPIFTLPVDPAETLIERLVNESAERGYGVENVRDGKVWL